MSVTTDSRNARNLYLYAKRRDAHRHRWLHDWVKPTRPTDYGERLTVALSVLVMLYTLAQLIRWAL